MNRSAFLITAILAGGGFLGWLAASDKLSFRQARADEPGQSKVPLATTTSARDIVVLDHGQSGGENTTENRISDCLAIGKCRRFRLGSTQFDTFPENTERVSKSRSSLPSGACALPKRGCFSEEGCFGGWEFWLGKSLLTS